jgi:preprotein translocase subunit Sec61beta
MNRTPPPVGYVASFLHFHERGFETPASNFFRGLLHYYGIEMQNLNPNSVLQIAIFVALCEGYLSIRPNFALWKYYFCATVLLKSVRKGESVPMRIGSCAIQIRRS